VIRFVIDIVLGLQHPQGHTFRALARCKLPCVMIATLLCHPMLCVNVAGLRLRDHRETCMQAVPGGYEVLGHCGCAGKQHGHYQGRTHHAYRITWRSHFQLLALDPSDRGYTCRLFKEAVNSCGTID